MFTELITMSTANFTLELSKGDVLGQEVPRLNLAYQVSAQSHFSIEGHWQILSELEPCKFRVTRSCVDFCVLSMQPAVVRCIKPVKSVKAVNWLVLRD